MLSCYGNFHQASSLNEMQNMSLETSDIGHRKILKHPAAFFWLRKFVTGLSRRARETRKPNLTSSADNIAGSQRVVRGDSSKSQDKEETFDTMIYGHA